jgi:glycyl-tRNA synthetase alpha subunit
VLDASGSIGVTERAAYILRVRQLAVAIAKAWVGEPQPPGENPEPSPAEAQPAGARRP